MKPTIKALVPPLFLLLFLLPTYATFFAYAGGTKDSSNPVDDNPILVGMSLPQQRTVRWANIRRTVESYASELPVLLELRFSDDDIYLQSYQMRKLVDLGVHTLAFATPPNTKYDAELLEALQYAKSMGVFVIAFDLFLPYSHNIDIFITYKFENFDRATHRNYASIQTEINRNFLQNRRQLIDLEALKQVLAEERVYMHYYDTELLARTILDAALHFSTNQLTPRNYKQIPNAEQSISTILLEPTIITKENYREALIEARVIERTMLE